MDFRLWLEAQTGDFKLMLSQLADALEEREYRIAKNLADRLLQLLRVIIANALKEAKVEFTDDDFGLIWSLWTIRNRSSLPASDKLSILTGVLDQIYDESIVKRLEDIVGTYNSIASKQLSPKGDMNFLTWWDLGDWNPFTHINAFDRMNHNIVYTIHHQFYRRYISVVKNLRADIKRFQDNI